MTTTHDATHPTHVTGCEGCRLRHNRTLGTGGLKRKAPVKDFACQECGKRLSLKAAERASFGPDGCPKCGGSDIDLYVPPAAGK